MESEVTEQVTPVEQEESIEEAARAPTSSRIKRIDASFEIGEEGTASYSTPPINGVLKAILLNLEGQTEVQISLRESEFSYPIFHNTLKHSLHYIPLRVEATAPDGQRLTAIGHEFCMVDGLDFEIYGSKGKKVTIIIHYV